MSVVQGVVDVGFDRVRDAFEANVRSRGELGAGCCIWVGGRVVVDLWSGTRDPAVGDPWTPDTIGQLQSAGKATTAIAAAMLVQRGDLDLDAPVARYWPEFATAGKADIPVRWVLSHQAGLPCGTRPITLDDAEAWEPVIRRLAEQAPLWPPGTGHGYHAGTFGFLVGELIRRVTGLRPTDFVAAEIAGPLGLGVWTALPEDCEARLAPLLPASPVPHEMIQQMRSMATGGDPELRRRAGTAVAVTAEEAASRRNRAVGWASGGFATARGFAELFAACLPSFGERLLLEPETVELIRTSQASGRDVFDGVELNWGLGMQLHSPGAPMGGPGCFGHAGYGGALGFAHPERDLAFGYVTNTCWPGPGGVFDERTRSLIHAVYASLAT